MFFIRLAVISSAILQDLRPDPAANRATNHYVAAREALIEVPDADMPGGWLPMGGHVPRLSETPTILARAAPRLGEHNEAILGAETCTRLRQAGAMAGLNI